MSTANDKKVAQAMQDRIDELVIEMNAAVERGEDGHAEELNFEIGEAGFELEQFMSNI